MCSEITILSICLVTFLWDDRFFYVCVFFSTTFCITFNFSCQSGSLSHSRKSVNGNYRVYRAETVDYKCFQCTTKESWGGGCSRIFILVHLSGDFLSERIDYFFYILIFNFCFSMHLSLRFLKSYSPLQFHLLTWNLLCTSLWKTMINFSYIHYWVTWLPICNCPFFTFEHF